MLWQLCYNNLRVDGYPTKTITKNFARNVDMSRDFWNFLEWNVDHDPIAATLGQGSANSLLQPAKKVRI